MFSSRNRSWLVLATAVLLASTAACGGTSGSATSPSDGVPAGDGVSLGSTITMTFDIAGAATVKGTSSSIPGVDNGVDPDNCAAYAKGGQKNGKLHYVLPRDMHDPIDGKQLLVGALVDDYTGPGTYGTDQLTDMGSPAGIDIDGKIYFQQRETKSEVVVDADGGGSWTFTELDVQKENNTQGGTPISGKVTWSCKD
jgi:hypothetical protein